MRLLWLLAVIVLYRGNTKGAEVAKPTSEPELLEAQPLLLKELVGASEELTAPLVKRAFQGGDVAATSEEGEKDKPRVKPQILPIAVGEPNAVDGEPAKERSPDVLHALPLVFKALVGANEDLIAPLIKKAFQGGNVAATSENGEKGTHTGVVGKPRPQVRPQVQPIRPIAVGEPNGQQPIDYSLDGYFYKGAKKIASYRIDFRGVHFSVKKERNEIDALIGELIDPVDPKLPRKEEIVEKEEKEEKEKKKEEKEKEKEEKEKANTPQNEPAPEKQAITPAAPIAGGGDIATEQHEINTRKEVEPTQKGPFDITEAPASGNDNKPTLIVEPAPEKQETTPAAASGDIVTDPHGNIIVEVEPTVKGPLAPRPSGNDNKSTVEVEEPEKKETTPAAPVSGGGYTTVKTDAPVSGDDSKNTPQNEPAPEKQESTPPAPTAEDDSKTTEAVEEPSATKEKRDSEKPTPSAPVVVGDVVYTDGLPSKPVFDKDSSKCHEYLAFTFNATAGRCLANKTSVCKEEDWEAYKKKTFRECMKSAPKDIVPVDGKNTSDCGYGKVYAQVPGEPTALLYGRRCNENFCPKEGTCVQEKYSAHCCILQRWEKYG